MSITVDLFLLSKKGLATLEEIVAKNWASLVGHVIIGQDKNTLNDYSDDIRKLCEDNSLLWNYRKDAPPLKANYRVAVSWRWMIKETENLIVFHDSPLPKYRGFAPLVNQLVNGEEKIGVTALFANAKYDRGEIIHQVTAPVQYPIKIADAIDIANKLYQELIVYIFQKISEKQMLEGQKQDESQATYSLWRDDKDYAIDWLQDASQIERFINAVGFPYSGARAFLNGREINVQNGEALDDLCVMNRDVGKVIFVEEGLPVIVCGQGLLKIKKAKYLDNQQSILPLSKFRSRFT